MLATGSSGTRLLALLVPALGLLNWHVLTSDVATSPLVPPPPIPPARQSPVESHTGGAAGLLQPLAMLTETTARPLFSPTRRPIMPEVAPAPAPAEPPRVAVSGLRVLGITRQSDGTARALIASPDRPNGEWLSAGQELAGLRLMDVSDVAVKLSAGRVQHVLELYAAPRPASENGKAAAGSRAR